jgi:hypothetical protein
VTFYLILRRGWRLANYPFKQGLYLFENGRLPSFKNQQIIGNNWFLPSTTRADESMG